MKRTPMTMRGAERLRQELKQLKSEARPNVIKAIAEARAHGDLSENAEYHAAREQQSFIEGRINDIENRLSNSEVIDVTKLSASGRIIHLQQPASGMVFQPFPDIPLVSARACGQLHGGRRPTGIQGLVQA